MDKRNSTFSWGMISRNRNTIYGLSIICIMLYHSSEINLNMFKLFNGFIGICNIGVDVFLFVSGISLYFSFSKNSNILRFYKRRFKRVLIPAMIVGIPYFFGRDVLVYKLGIKRFLMNLTGLSLFTARVKTVWFVTAIILFYLVYPLLYKFFDKLNWKMHSLMIALAIVLGASALFWLMFPESYHNAEILYGRFPIFVAGAYCGRIVYTDKTTKCPLGIAAALGVITTVLFLLLHMKVHSTLISYRYIYGIAAIPIAILFSIMGNIKWISSTAGSLAPYTFEIYLLNEKSSNLVERLLNVLGIGHAWCEIIFRNAAAMVVTVIFAVLLKKVGRCISF